MINIYYTQPAAAAFHLFMHGPFELLQLLMQLTGKNNEYNTAVYFNNIRRKPLIPD